MAFYEFTEEENTVFKGLALRMNIAGVLLLSVGIALFLYAIVIFPLTVGLVLLVANSILLFGIGYLTFRAAKRYTAIVETQGHDIMHLMEAMVSTRQLYTLVSAMIGLVVVFVAVTASFIMRLE